MIKKNLIVIVGGLGPMAGVLFHRHLILNTVAKSDRDHIDTIHLSFPDVADRTVYLKDTSHVNPGAVVGANVYESIGSLTNKNIIMCVSCNTFHSKAI